MLDSTHPYLFLMVHLNVEIKAKCSNQDKIRNILLDRKAQYKGTDHQVDTYFQVPKGRLKLRQSTIKSGLVHYQRSNQTGPKGSQVTVFHTQAANDLKAVLSQAIEILAIVDKTREIYFIDNVKFHIDLVQGLGSFIEIEAVDTDAMLGIEKLTEQCNFYLNLFAITEKNLIAESYSDMVLKKDYPNN